MRAAQMRGRGAPPGLIETLFNHSRTSSDRKCLLLLERNETFGFHRLPTVGQSASHNTQILACFPDELD